MFDSNYFQLIGFVISKHSMMGHHPVMNLFSTVILRGIDPILGQF